MTEDVNHSISPLISTLYTAMILNETGPSSSSNRASGTPALYNKTSPPITLVVFKLFMLFTIFNDSLIVTKANQKILDSFDFHYISSSVMD